MLKKVLISLAIGSSLLTTAPMVMDVPNIATSVAEAADVYVATNDDGVQFYVVKESIALGRGIRPSCEFKEVSTYGTLLNSDAIIFQKSDNGWIYKLRSNNTWRYDLDNIPEYRAILSYIIH